MARNQSWGPQGSQWRSDSAAVGAILTDPKNWKRIDAWSGTADMTYPDVTGVFEAQEVDFKCWLARDSKWILRP